MCNMAICVKSSNTIKFLEEGSGEETFLQKGPSPDNSSLLSLLLSPLFSSRSEF
jgi:hypothetical protein